MSAFNRIHTVGKNTASFDVMQAFAGLDSSRKMALFDRLSDSRQNFYKTVTLFWPQAQTEDCKKLERFLVKSIAANDC